MMKKAMKRMMWEKLTKWVTDLAGVVAWIGAAATTVSVVATAVAEGAAMVALWCGKATIYLAKAPVKATASAVTKVMSSDA
jgi:hypothetical protein